MAEGVFERLGSSLRRSPYVWLALSVLLLLMMIPALSGVAKGPADANTAIAIAGAAFIAYGVGLWFLLPRLMTRRAPVPPSPDRIASLRWVLATAPFVMGYAVVAAGGQQWALALGTVTSVALLISSARALRRSDTTVT